MKYKLPLRGPEQPLKRSPMGRLKPHSPRTYPIVRERRLLFDTLPVNNPVEPFNSVLSK
jgi:hypothetical protein